LQADPGWFIFYYSWQVSYSGPQNALVRPRHEPKCPEAFESDLSETVASRVLLFEFHSQEQRPRTIHSIPFISICLPASSLVEQAHNSDGIHSSNGYPSFKLQAIILFSDLKGYLRAVR